MVFCGDEQTRDQGSSHLRFGDLSFSLHMKYVLPGT